MKLAALQKKLARMSVTASTMCGISCNRIGNAANRDIRAKGKIDSLHQFD
jgi:hypothetical protein